MHSLLLRSMQGYLRDTFGPAVWAEVVRSAGLSIDHFEPMLRYEPGLLTSVAQAAAAVLSRPVDSLWEDLGTYLVTNPGYEPVRRLLRFGGGDFSEFLHSLEELPGRAKLAMPDLEVPEFVLEDLGSDRFRLTCHSQVAGSGIVLLGMIRAMADDYGALVLTELEPGGPAGEVITLAVAERAFATGRSFDLALPGV